MVTVSCQNKISTSPIQFTPSIKPTSVSFDTPDFNPTEIQNSTETIPKESPTLKQKNTGYFLEVFYDNDSQLIKVAEQVNFINQTGIGLDLIPFIVPSGIQLTQISVNGKLVTSIPGNTENSLRISLLDPLALDASVEIQLTYTLDIPASKGVLGRTGRQVNLAEFYPVIPPYKSGEEWLINEPGAVGEYMVYQLSDFDLTFTTNIASEYDFFSNAHSEKIDDQFFIKAINYRNVVLSICLECIRSEYDYGTFKVIGSFASNDGGKGEAAIAIIGKSILYFSSLFGVAYPHDEMTIIEADFPDGLEYDGLFFLSKDYFDQYDGSFQNYISLLCVHETAHQWWYGIVGSDQAKEPWLDEALSTYNELLFVEEYYPDLSSWWWKYRVYTYNPSGSVSSSIYEFQNTRAYINAVYLQGALYLDQLRSILPEGVFISRLKDYAQKYNGEIADTTGFENIFLIELTPEMKAIRGEYFRN